MSGITRHSIDEICDRIEDICATWGERLEQMGRPVETADRLRIALHEWMGALAEEADFEGRLPSVLFNIETDGQALTCVVTDNSTGLQLAGICRPAHQSNVPLRYRQRLLMVHLAVDWVTYRHRKDGNRLHLRIHDRPAVSTPECPRSQARSLETLLMESLFPTEQTPAA